MTTEKQTATPLAISNENNKLNCKVFSYINFAPKEKITEEQKDRLFVIDNEGEQIFAKCLQVHLLKFWEIDSYDTLLASALEARLWKMEFKKRNPSVTDETEMAIYTFVKYEQ